MKRVIVELKVQVSWSKEAIMAMAASLPGFHVDRDYEPETAPPSEEEQVAVGSEEVVVLVRGMVSEVEEEDLRSAPNVIAVWTDARIEPFGKD